VNSTDQPVQQSKLNQFSLINSTCLRIETNAEITKCGSMRHVAVHHENILQIWWITFCNTHVNSIMT